METITPALMFVGDQYGKAEEAMNLYISTFERSHVDHVERFGDDEAETGIKHARFTLAGRQLTAMDSGGAHAFGFTPAVSLVVEFDDEASLDAAFATLAEGGTVLMALADYGFSAKFGWLNDRFGVSWQLTLPLEQ
jgi:predicted 3-demethylubiquinone-9 3-methyltransferase (glyoxalase superfamily)